MDFIASILMLYVDRYDFFLKLLIEHIVICLTAICLVTVIGIGLGICISRNKNLARVVLSVSDFIYTIPSIALLGFLVVLTGIGNTSALIAIVMYGVLPVLRATYVGICEVDSQLVEAAVGMGSTDKQLLWKVQFPLALPVIISGFRTMVVMTIALGGIASFIGAGGLGVAIWRGITTNHPALTAAGSLLVAGLAVSADWLLEHGEKRIRRYVLGEK